MVARSKPRGAAPPVRFTSATRTAHAEPGRAGAVRLAAMAFGIAALSGAQAWWTVRSAALGQAELHLTDVRDAAARSLGAAVERTERDTAALADDPRTARAFRDLRDGFLRAGDELVGHSSAKLAQYDAPLSKYYDTQVIPGLTSA